MKQYANIFVTHLPHIIVKNHKNGTGWHINAIGRLNCLILKMIHIRAWRAVIFFFTSANMANRSAKVFRLVR